MLFTFGRLKLTILSRICFALTLYFLGHRLSAEKMNKNFFLVALLLSALLGWATGMIFESSETLQSISLLLKTTFFAVLKMVIGPLIFFSVFSGVLGLGNKASASRIGGVTFVYYLTTTGIAISIGLVAVFFIHPWTSYPPILSLIHI